MRDCDTTAVSATAEGNIVVIVLRDSARIARLFGLRPAFVHVSEARPDGIPPFDSVRVEYVAPEIPDAATRADAERSARRYQASIRYVRRFIDAGDGADSPLRLQVGDSVPLRLNEHDCVLGACMMGLAMATDSGWTVDDSSIARLQSPAHDVLSGGATSAGVRFHLKAIRPGRTTVRVRGVHAPSDTALTRTPPMHALAQDVIVTPPLAGIRISPRYDVVVAGRMVLLAARVFDTSGRPVAEYPVLFDVEGERGARGAHSESVISLDLRRLGRTRVIARVPGLADTLVVTVVDSNAVAPKR